MDRLTSRFRLHPRVPVATLCNAVVGEREQLALVVDLSERGLRLERPLRGRSDGSIVQLEFELPEVDEIVWAKGEVCFDQLRAPSSAQVARAVRATGVRILAAASRHLRMIRDYVHAMADARDANERPVDLAFASHWSG